MKDKENKAAETVKEPMSLSKIRKLERKKAIAKQKRDAAIGKVVSIIVIAALCVGILAWAGTGIYKAIVRIKPSDDYSAMLNDDGTIQGINAADYITLPEYKNLTVAYADIEYTDEELEEAILALLEDKAELSLTTDKVLEDGDKVNIDYVGTVDSVEFDGGSTEGEGSDVTIGSGSLIDDFEEQLIGHKIGDNFLVMVTFPDTYTSNPDLAGKDAIFDVTINGIYVAPEFDDAFVAENLSEYATTAEEYKEYLREQNEETNLHNYLASYLLSDTGVISYPEEYHKHLQRIAKYSEQMNYQYMVQLYAAYYGYNPYKNFEAYLGMSELEFDKTLPSLVEEDLKEILIYQAIAQAEGITATVDEAKAYMLENGYTEETFAEALEAYGTGYIVQPMITLRVLEMMEETVTITNVTVEFTDTTDAVE